MDSEKFQHNINDCNYNNLYDFHESMGNVAIIWTTRYGLTDENTNWKDEIRRWEAVDVIIF